ncbi:MAG: hypothetical protein IKM18_02465, partial [Clostridia bacterium]|nr:hypothetical protein [Clostridia bacterium]
KNKILFYFISNLKTKSFPFQQSFWGSLEHLFSKRAQNQKIKYYFILSAILKPNLSPFSKVFGEVWNTFFQKGVPRRRRPKYEMSNMFAR